MLPQGASFLLLFLCQALSLPLPTQLSKEDEKVIKCISEILADTLSSPSPIPVTSECMKILREDERVLAMLHHQHLLTELEELAHQENAKHRIEQEGDHNAWGEEQQGEIKTREEPAQHTEAAPEEVEEHAGKREKEEEEEEEMKKYEKTKNTREKIKASQGEDLREALEEQAEEEQQEEKEIKKRSSSETWSSKEYFGHVKRRGPRQPKIRKGMLQGDEEGRKRHEMAKRRFRLDEEEEDDTSEEEPKKYHHGGYGDHEKWEGEEERSDMAKRVAEKASDEETAQFEEEKGLKTSNSKAHLHKGQKPWQEEEEEENHSKMRHGHHHKPVGLDLRKRHWKDEVYLNGRHHAPEEEEEEDKEASQSEAQELDKLEEIERELKWAADKLEELKRG
ncbi:coiled-coil domain-containing glutamate-rich protein 2 [Candoia aspera]|uniref:coiled-coil domain-containing glutamate-rich protein 2 n=1 Tax=Candoia aspera TaxID=51853 RepID=UPI002FD85DE5